MYTNTNTKSITIKGFMKDKFLKNVYRYDEKDDTYHVVVDLDTYRDVYSAWDYSPMNNRDIDEDLLDFLMDCSSEIGINNKMIVDFYIPKEIIDPEREAKSIDGFRQYFFYRIRKIKVERVRRIKSALVLFFIGLGLLSISNFVKIIIPYALASELISEGLFIGAWVAIWEIFNTMFFEVSALNHKIRHFSRLKNAPINYKQK